MFRKLRITLLLIILAFVAANTWLDRVYSRDWNGALQVALFPVNADGSATSREFIAALQRDDAQGLETFFSTQATRYELPLERPLRFTIANPLSSPPPLLPDTDQPPSRWQIAWWSLKLRWFTWCLADPAGPTPTIRIFMLFHDPQLSPVVPHSTGLEKGLAGIAHLFASNSMQGANQVIVAHELLHTLGATDKYDPDTNQPLFPDGYADPEREPRLPQHQAELMAGRIPVSEQQAEQAESLKQVMVGPASAREIGWLLP